MKIAFHVPHFSLRGTEVATYDYARYSQELLGHEPLIVYQDWHPATHDIVQRKFAARFPMVAFSEFSEVDGIVEKAGTELFYILKSGAHDGKIVRTAPNAVHAVFPTKQKDFHGERFAFVSEWLSQACSKGREPFVPHIVELPKTDKNLRAELAVPPETIVFGYYGGWDSFNIKFAKRAVRDALEHRKDACFLFMNIEPFVSHERAIFLPGSADPIYKAAFINACDAMLHARDMGESFGIACGEFSIMNRPVITYAKSPQRSHLDILGSKAIRYANQKELEGLLLGLTKGDLSGDWDCYSKQFSPRVVMTKFSEVFIEGKPASAVARLPLGDRLRSMIGR